MSLLDLLPGLHRAGATHGGEYGGPCPWCGGRDRFRAWPDHPSGRPRWWCRQCGKSGDTADLLHLLRGVPLREALRLEGVSQKAPVRPTERPLRRPGQAWQQRAEKLAQDAETALWRPEGTRALDYLRGRGLTDETIHGARLGYVPEDLREPAERWGLPHDHKPVWVPRGICLPWRAEGLVWKLSIRRPAGHPKYVQPAGGCNGLYGADGLQEGQPAMLAEGELDALSVAQEAGGLVAAVASGSTCGARHSHWQRRLSRCSVVLIAFDNDKPGETAAQWWLERLPKAIRLVPVGGKDCNSMLTRGANLRTWVRQGLNLTKDRKP